MSALVLLQNNKNFDGCVVTPWYCVEFEVVTAVVIEKSVFWDIKLCGPLKVSHCFGGTCCLHLQGRRINQARNQHEAGNKFACLLA
jgi:hypothetical protein